MRSVWKVIAIVAVVLLVSFTPKQQKSFTFTFTPEETGVVFEALGELPAKRTESIRAKIIQEVDKQQVKK
jgi:hypothetical protein